MPSRAPDFVTASDAAATARGPRPRAGDPRRATPRGRRSTCRPRRPCRRPRRAAPGSGPSPSGVRRSAPSDPRLTRTRSALHPGLVERRELALVRRDELGERDRLRRPAPTPAQGSGSSSRRARRPHAAPRRRQRSGSRGPRARHRRVLARARRSRPRPVPGSPRHSRRWRPRCCSRRRVDEDQRDPGRLIGKRPQLGDVDALGVEGSACRPTEVVVPDRADERCRRPEPGRGDRLVPAFPAMVLRETTADDGLTGRRQRAAGDDQVDVDRPDDDSPAPVMSR